MWRIFRYISSASRGTNTGGRGTNLGGRGTNLRGRGTNMGGRGTNLEGRGTNLGGCTLGKLGKQGNIWQKRRAIFLLKKTQLWQNEHWC